MSVRDRWQLLAKYNRLVDDGDVEPITDKICGHELTSMLGQGDEPVFFCSMCNAITYPGILFWERLQQKVDDADLCGP